MCAPGCQHVVMRRLSRRGFFKGAGAAAAAGVALQAPPVGAQGPVAFDRVVDLTHPLGADFPTFSGQPGIEMERLVSLETDGYTMYRWLLVEHTGTHMDAPIHFSADGMAVDELPAENLVVPLAVVDIAARAAEDADAQLTPDDLTAWEADHGPIPDGACVAMNSGWDAHVATDRFRNADAAGGLHFPGFHVEAVDFLLTERNAAGIAVDTLSLDYGPSADFATHYRWLPANRWGLEAVANLGGLPASGATLIVGSPRIRGATGGPSRIMALV